MESHRIVSREQWIAARMALLAKEKEFTRARDRLSQERRELPWVRVNKPYVFDGPDGKVTLGDLFAERSQLIVYHFMFAPEWEEGCKSCSFWADNFERSVVHLAARLEVPRVEPPALRPVVQRGAADRVHHGMDGQPWRIGRRRIGAMGRDLAVRL